MSDNFSLSERLGRYSISARGQIARGPSLGELAGYAAAAAGAGLVMAGGADAAIIYSGIQNKSISIDPAQQATAGQNPFYNSAGSLGIDIDGDSGGADVILQLRFQGQHQPHVSVTTSGTSTNGVDATYYGIAANVRAAAGVAFLGSSANPGQSLDASILARGAEIGSDGPWNAQSAGLAFQRNHTASTFNQDPQKKGNFLLSQTGIIGFRLDTGDYGWIRMHISNLGPNNPFSGNGHGGPYVSGDGFPDQITVVDWAYATGGEEIAAGVPVPPPLALLAAGAVGIRAFRRRKPTVSA